MTNHDEHNLPLTAADPQQALACVQAFVAHLKNDEIAAAQALAIVPQIDGMAFDASVFPDLDGVVIGEPEQRQGATGSLTVVPCTFQKPDGSTELYPAVCKKTAAGVRIDLMHSVQLAMSAELGIDLSDMPSGDSFSSGLNDQLESMTHDLGSTIKHMTDSIGQMFGEFADAMSEASEPLGSDHDQQQLTTIKQEVIPGLAEQLHALTGHNVAVKVAWPQAENPSANVDLISASLVALTGACTQLAKDPRHPAAYKRIFQDLSLQWGSCAAATLNSQALSIDFGTQDNAQLPSADELAVMMHKTFTAI